MVKGEACLLCSLRFKRFKDSQETDAIRKQKPAGNSSPNLTHNESIPTNLTHNESAWVWIENAYKILLPRILQPDDGTGKMWIARSKIRIVSKVTLYIIDVCRYILKDELQGSDVGYRKQQRLYYANIVFISLYAYCVWRLLALLFGGLVSLLALQCVRDISVVINKFIFKNINVYLRSFIIKNSIPLEGKCR